MLLDNSDPAFTCKALVIRTSAQPGGKAILAIRRGSPPGVLSRNEAMNYIHGLGVEHLLVDLPSVDRLFDEGKLSNHRIYWQLEKEGHQVDLGNSFTRHRTITEFVYVSNHLEDGHYLLNLQIAPFLADAAPSRPQLYRISSADH